MEEMSAPVFKKASRTLIANKIWLNFKVKDEKVHFISTESVRERNKCDGLPKGRHRQKFGAFIKQK